MKRSNLFTAFLSGRRTVGSSGPRVLCSLFHCSLFFSAALLLFSCKQGNPEQPEPSRVEDKEAKRMLEGIWINEDEQSVAFRVKGDSIFYPDSTSLPVSFQVFADTLVMHGASDMKYAIVKQAPHLFVFKNQSGDEVRLVKSEDPIDNYAFKNPKPQAINQDLLIKRDTIVMYGSQRYHCYVQVNPTTYKVIKRTYNDEGVAVDNIYHDNIINLAVYQGASKVFSSDFHKQDFKKYLTEEILKQSVLSDMIYNRLDEDGIHYDAFIGIPDSPSGYVVDVQVGYDGKVKFEVYK